MQRASVYCANAFCSRSSSLMIFEKRMIGTKYHQQGTERVADGWAVSHGERSRCTPLIAQLTTEETYLRRHFVEDAFAPLGHPKLEPDICE